MHTASQLSANLFDYEVAGSAASLADVFPGWGPLDRFGIVVHEPFGALGASFLIQSATVAWYDAVSERRNRPLYPDIFLFHVGGRFGDHAHFDFYPPRKEIFVENRPAEILRAINDRGLTFLAVPDRLPERVQHEYKEPAQAFDRIRGAFAYDTRGRVSTPDMAISTTHRVCESNAKMTLSPTTSYQERQEMMAALGRVSVPDDELFVAPDVSRKGEVDQQTRERASAFRSVLQDGKRWAETYRRVSVADSLQMLHAGEAPPFANPAPLPK